MARSFENQRNIEFRITGLLPGHSRGNSVRHEPQSILIGSPTGCDPRGPVRMARTNVRQGGASGLHAGGARVGVQENSTLETTTRLFKYLPEARRASCRFPRRWSQAFALLLI